MDFLEIIKAIAPLVAIFGIFTFIIHIYQSVIMKANHKETMRVLEVNHRETMRVLEVNHRETMRVSEVNHKATMQVVEKQSQMLERMDDTQRYIADLVKIEGEKTREFIEAS
jgi:hypothetical protein